MVALRLKLEAFVFSEEITTSGTNLVLTWKYLCHLHSLLTNLIYIHINISSPLLQKPSANNISTKDNQQTTRQSICDIIRSSCSQAISLEGIDEPAYCDRLLLHATLLLLQLLLKHHTPNIKLDYTTPHLVTPHHVTPHLVAPHHLTPHLVTPHHTTSHHITSHHIKLHYIPKNHIKSLSSTLTPSHNTTSRQTHQASNY